jgi:phosphoribosylanthranilate isomerase
VNVRVKICGLTNIEDGLAALDAGADALGFVLYASSPRCVPLEQAAEMVKQLPPFIAKVGLFVNASELSIRHAIEQCGIDTLQLHGDEAPEFCRRFQLKVIKAIRMRDASSLDELAQYETSGWLLDSYVAGKAGGTGEKFNWELACRATELCSRVILAGGLTPANVAEAVRQVRPYAVDVSSGVEWKPGKKDRHKMKDFIAAAKGA